MHKVPMLSVMSDLCVLEGDVDLVHDWKGENSVAVRHHLYADPDPSFHFDANPDPTFYFAFPDPDPAPHRSNTNLRPLVCRPSTLPFVSVHGRPFLAFTALGLWLWLGPGSGFPWALIRTHIDPDPLLCYSGDTLREEGELFRFPSGAARGRGAYMYHQNPILWRY